MGRVVGVWHGYLPTYRAVLVQLGCSCVFLCPIHYSEFQRRELGPPPFLPICFAYRAAAHAYDKTPDCCHALGNVCGYQASCG